MVFFQNNLYHLIIFPAEHLLLPLLYYSIGIDTSFENISKGFDCVLRWRLDRRSHVRDRRSERSGRKRLTIFEGIVAERDVEYCLYVQVHACICMWVGGCVCVRE